MRLLLLIGIMSITSCSSLPSKNQKNVRVEFKIDVPAPFYEAFADLTWSVGNSVCLDLMLNKPYYGTEWKPSLNISIENDKNDFSKVFLYTDEKLNNNIIVYSSQSSPTNSSPVQLWKGVQFGESFRIKLTVTDDNKLVLNYKNKEQATHLKFAPNRFTIGASSSISTTKILEPSECDPT